MAKIDIDNLEVAIADVLEQYGDLVFEATDKGLSAGQKVLIRRLKAASPVDTGEYSKSWKGKKKYKLKRYVGNTKVVPSGGGEIPLSNILEYSTKSPYQGQIKRTYQNSLDEMARAIIDEINKI